MGISKGTGLLFRLLKKIIPVYKKRMVFTSFEGHYSDSPKYISQSIHELSPSVELVWLVKKRYMDSVPEYVKCIDIDSVFVSFWYRATACVIVDNVYGGRESYLYKGNKSKLRYKISVFLNNKRNQTVFTTWHGTPLKRMGRDQINSDILDFSCPQTTMVMGNKFTLEIMEHLTFGKIKMELLGTPRNDILFADEEEKRKLKSKLGLPANKKIILFAPTFRSDNSDAVGKRNILRSGINQLNEIDFSVLFQKLSDVFGGEWAMVCRFHYHVEEMVDWGTLNEDYPESIINGNINDDMAEYLACTDVLLTDASSSMFDFAITKKPCFLFFPDLEHYQNVERGFYLPIENLPFKVSKTFSDFIRSLDEFDEGQYVSKTEKMLSGIGSVDDVNSSRRVAEYILEKRLKNETPH